MWWGWSCQLADMREEMERLIRRVDVDVAGATFPGIEVPEPELSSDPTQGREPLCDSSWSLADRIDRLQAAKRYEA
jgi:hypothetical protein